MRLTAYDFEVIPDEMFEILVEDSFARWFESLSPGAAERVAAALEVDRATAPQFDPARHGRLLLWFDGARPGSWQALKGIGLEFFAPPQALLDRYREFIDWQQQALACLETREFAHGLARLDARAAADALVCVAELRGTLRATRRGAGLALAMRSSKGYRSQAPLELDDVLRSQIEAVKQKLQAALARVGLGLEDIVERDAAIRELKVCGASADAGGGELGQKVGADRGALRILYGLDIQNQKLVALAGDALDHAYYGDSVRRAERDWKRYREKRWSSLVGVDAERKP